MQSYKINYHYSLIRLAKSRKDGRTEGRKEGRVAIKETSMLGTALPGFGGCNPP